MDKAFNTFRTSGFSVNFRGRLVDFSTPKIMGIVNITPDSFSDGGKFRNHVSALKHTEKMIAEGAEIIDIGAQSTRPSAQFLSADEEIGRLGKLISTVKSEFPDVLISLDTFHSAVVAFGYNEGIDLVNDISGGMFDAEMFKTVAESGLPYVLMHVNPSYGEMHRQMIKGDILTEMNRYFSEKILELRKLGVIDIIIDPGFGFGKTVEQQHQLFGQLQHLDFGRSAMLIGISRKSFIYKPLGKSPLDINEETQKLHLKALQKGAKILRVHDVASAAETVRRFSATN